MGFKPDLPNHIQYKQLNLPFFIPANIKIPDYPDKVSEKVCPFKRMLRAGYSNSQLELLNASSFTDLQSKGRLGKFITLLTNPSVVKSLLTFKSKKFIKSPVVVWLLKPLIGNSLFICNEQDWAGKRKSLEMSLRSIPWSVLIDKCNDSADSVFQHFCSQPHNRVTANAIAQFYSADSVARVLTGHSIGAISGFDEIMKVFHSYESNILRCAFLANLGFPKLILGYLFKFKANAVRSWVEKLVLNSTLYPNANQQPTILDVLWHRESNPVIPSVPLDVLDTSNDIMLSGYSTTASAVASMLYLLSLYSDEQQLVRNEVRSFTTGLPRSLEEHELSSAIYSMAFVAEVLRLYPPVSFIQRIATSHNQFVESIFEEGSLILVSPWAIHRHYKFWERPNHFCPQRWLDSNGSVAQKISDAQYLPFGKGHRGCPGEKLANTILLVILTRIVQKFEIKRVTHARVAWKSQLSLRSSKPISLLIRKI